MTEAVPAQSGMVALLLVWIGSRPMKTKAEVCLGKTFGLVPDPWKPKQNSGLFGKTTL